MFNLRRVFAAKPAPAAETVTARLNARLQPIDRGEQFEHPLGEALQSEGLGEVVGGGTQLAGEPAGIEFCDVEIRLKHASEPVLRRVIERLEFLGAPKGSRLIIESSGREIAFGNQEGLALVLNGTDLPAEIYASCDINHVVSELSRLMGEKGSFRGYWEGSKETSLYCYGGSFVEMSKAIEPLLNNYPLCRGAKVEQIA
jgi:hypothetical protein